ncbi:MAG: bifunctional UDP-sugar hydrolase/5'-nucleotidase, partial [Elusimicrobia bacterium]|nr:bifunctional UDP-sugar hydrolase/5'-nucleotidase [Elusimicrobiota bacterium]
MRYFKRLLLFFGFVAIAAGSYLYYFNSNVRRFDIVYTSDGHGNVLPSVDYETEGHPKIGGLAVLGGYLSEINVPYMLTDSGDMFQGTPEGILSKGKLVIDIMNVLGYSAAAAGNHDFDLGRDTLRNLTQVADFPILGANILETETGLVPEYLTSRAIYNLNGLRIGIIGVITEDMADISMKENIKGLEFVDPVPAISKSVEEIKDDTDIIVLLSHRGISYNAREKGSSEKKYSEKKYSGKDIKLTENISGVDLILSGHSHIPVKKPIINNNVLVSQPGSNFKYAGRITLYYSSAEKKVLTYKESMTPLYIKDFKPDKRIEDMIKIRMKDISGEMGKVIGRSIGRLSKNLSGEERKHGELALGNWQTDLMREETESDFAFQNSGGIRDDIPKGDVAVRDIWKLSPFGNTLVTMKLTGKQVRELLEQSASQEYSKLQISGLKMIYNESMPKGKRVLNVIVKDKDGEEMEIDPEQEYK